MHNSIATAVSTYCLESFEYRLAFHCAPAIAGMKPSNLISIKKPLWDKMRLSLSCCAGMLHSKEVFIYKLVECSKRVLLLVFHQKLLLKHLLQMNNYLMLKEFGYDPGRMSLDEMLRHLAERFKAGEEYPHEIGIFLGYPASDVRGFIAHKGQNFHLCGYWKVYDDPHRAKEIFSAYDRVRNYYCRQVLSGEKIHTIQYGGTLQ